VKRLEHEPKRRIERLATHVFVAFAVIMMTFTSGSCSSIRSSVSSPFSPDVAVQEHDREFVIS